MIPILSLARVSHVGEFHAGLVLSVFFFFFLISLFYLFLLFVSYLVIHYTFCIAESGNL